MDTCGYCLDTDDCHHVNGTCVMGCEPGYKGDLCKAGLCYFQIHIFHCNYMGYSLQTLINVIHMEVTPNSHAEVHVLTSRLTQR